MLRSLDGKTPKFALVSHVLPPSPSGQAVVLYRLLRDLDPHAYCLISAKDYGPSDARATKGMNPGTVTKRLNGPYYSIPQELGLRLSPWMPMVRKQIHAMLALLRDSSHTDGPHIGVSSHKPASGWKAPCRDFVLWVEDLLNVRRQVQRRARHILRIVEKEQCAAIVACSGDLLDLPAAYLAAQRAKLPFYAYMLDDYAEHFVSRFQRAFAREVTPRMLRRSAGVMVPNEFLARAYRRRFGIEPWIIANPIDELISDIMPLQKTERGPRIVYTGAIYEAHFDAFQRLIGAVDTLRSTGVELHLYTANDRQYLERHQIGAPAIVHAAVSAADAIRLQKSADIVFLPLAFDSPMPEIINTSAPGKMGELLASGRPILVHAPRDSFLSWYFRKHGCGAVVDERDPALLVQAIQRLLGDTAYREGLVSRARQRADSDFSLSVSRERFFQLLANGLAPEAHQKLAA